MKPAKLLLTGLLIALTLLLASSSLMAYSAYWYVKPSSVSLRECPSSECAALQTVYQGEKVEILERNNQGWSKVRLVERSAIGWITNDLLSYSPDLVDRAFPPYYVNTSSVPLRDKPNPNAKVLTTLQANEPVEMMGVGSGWAQVRELHHSLVGWVDPRYLSTGAANYPKSSPRRRAPVRKAPPPEKEKPAPEDIPPLPKPM